MPDYFAYILLFQALSFAWCVHGRYCCDSTAEAHASVIASVSMSQGCIQSVDKRTMLTLTALNAIWSDSKGALSGEFSRQCECKLVECKVVW